MTPEVDNTQAMLSTEARTPWQIAWRRLRRHRMAIFGLRVLVVLYLLTAFAGFFAPYHYDNERRDHSYHPPRGVHFYDRATGFHLRPFVYESSYEFDDYFNRVWKRDTSKRYPVRFFVEGDEYQILGLISSKIHLFGVEEPGRLYPFGADYRGRDLFSRVLFGGQISLTIGLVGVTISFIIGMIVGGISGYVGGNTDFVIQRLCEMVMLIPGFYLLLVLHRCAGVLGRGPARAAQYVQLRDRLRLAEHSLLYPGRVGAEPDWPGYPGPGAELGQPAPEGDERARAEIPSLDSDPGVLYFHRGDGVQLPRRRVA